RPALQDSIRRWRLAVDVNLNGPFYLSWHLGRRMAEAGGGRVINVSSAAAVMPSFGRPSYTATKLAPEGLTEAPRHELAGRAGGNELDADRRADLERGVRGHAAPRLRHLGLRGRGDHVRCGALARTPGPLVHRQDPHPHRAAPAGRRPRGGAPSRPARLIAITPGLR